MAPPPDTPGPYRPGDFVICNFPYDEAPDAPGPSPHIGLCLGTMPSGGRTAVVLGYTTSQPWPEDRARPPGVYAISEAKARQLGQNKAFTIDLRRIAFLPETRTFFPKIDQPDRGTAGSDRDLADRLFRDLQVLIDGPGIVVKLGPLRPNR